MGMHKCRIRIYIVAVRMDGYVLTGLEPTSFFGAVSKLLDELKTGPLPLKKFLFPSDDPYLKAELDRRQAIKAEQEQRVLNGEIQRVAWPRGVLIFELFEFWTSMWLGWIKLGGH